ncbi:MAG: helix-hairpin-helix domain-containing protein [Chitinophagaceae bacterium]
MKWKEIVTDYLTFTRKERIGIITVLLLIIISLVFPISSDKDVAGHITTDTTWIAAVKKLEQKAIKTKKNAPDDYESNTYAFQYDPSQKYYYDNKAGGELFYFDPNTLSRNGWQKLGIRDKTIQIIQNYLAKGGHFKKPEDLQRVYGLHHDQYERLLPFVKIETRSPENEQESFARSKHPEENNRDFKHAFQNNPININTADTSGFISLQGIGSKLAGRIINFRDKLGGFYSVDQVKETFGLPDSTFQKIKQYLTLENISIKKININAATADELKAHPYIRYNLANPIIAYRDQHGSFSSIEDLKKIMIITDDIYKKISPYLSTQ